ncbi:MAG: ATP-binding protein [Pseudomonadota bacterium]
MKISIRFRLFLSILAATCVALSCMFLIMYWNINRGFLQYIEASEHGLLERTVKNMEQAYGEHGNWNFLRSNPELWMFRLSNHHLDNMAIGEWERAEGRKNIPPPPLSPMGSHRPGGPFIVLDAERHPVFGNPEEIKGVRFKSIVRLDRIVGYVGLLPPRPFIKQQQLQFLSRQKTALVLSAIGLLLTVVLFSFPLANRLVKPLRAMAVATHDIASGKYAVRVPVETSDELGKLAGDFNTMALSLEKNEKARRQWVADISHELRTPVSVLRGEIEALLEGIRTINPEAIRSLHGETLRLQRLIEDLYQLALSDLGTLTYHKENLDPVEVLDDSLMSYHEEFDRKSLGLSTDTPKEFRALVFADPARLHQLFTNLLDNSLKYTDPGGELIIRLTCSNGQVVIEFEDSRPGVPEETLERLFDRLYRVEKSRNRASGGAGLGLAICRNIVEAHGGIIVAHPSRLGGLLIRVTLPMAGGCS